MTATEAKINISVAFYGAFRPLHVEADCMKNALALALGKISCENLKSEVKDICRDYTRQRKAGIGIVSACKDNGRFSVRVSEGKRDTWLDSLTVQMPLHPAIDYSH
jgi:hypothetical protein